MKVYTTTPKHDKQFILTPVDVMMMLDMYQHWYEPTNKETACTIKLTPDGTDAFMFVNPTDVEWGYMRENSFILLRNQNHSIEPFMLS